MIKKIKGEFKTKTISIRRAKDPRTFKCSKCDKCTTTVPLSEADLSCKTLKKFVQTQKKKYQSHPSH